MIRRGIKVTACVLAATIIISGNAITVHATSMESVLPAAGLGLTLEEGDSLKNVDRETTTTTQKEIIEPLAAVSAEEEIAEEVQEDFSNLVIAQVNDYVNVRSIPSEEGEIVGKLYDKSVGNYLEEENGWYKIESGNCTG